MGRSDSQSVSSVGTHTQDKGLSLRTVLCMVFSGVSLVAFGALLCYLVVVFAFQCPNIAPKLSLKKAHLAECLLQDVDETIDRIMSQHASQRTKLFYEALQVQHFTSNNTMLEAMIYSFVNSYSSTNTSAAKLRCLNHNGQFPGSTFSLQVPIFIFQIMVVYNLNFWLQQ